MFVSRKANRMKHAQKVIVLMMFQFILKKDPERERPQKMSRSITTRL